MGTQGFIFEDCLLKHYVRTQGWLPFCIERKKQVNKGKKPDQQRRLRYFTFCAIGAIDVLMLDVAKVLRPSVEERFDTVVFFDRDADAVLETQKRIPGASGFPGTFTDVVLAVDPLGSVAEDFLSSPPDQNDDLKTRQNQRILAQRREFIKSFPFDIINLDLEEFAFKPNDPFPGKIINALRKIFEWQRSPLNIGKEKAVGIDGFTLMFTTQIGPPDFNKEYAAMLRESLASNIRSYPELSEIMVTRVGTDDLETLQVDHFDSFFKLGLPKILSGLLREQDWSIDPDQGIRVFEFARPRMGGEYRILHFVMQVSRQSPPRERRAPNSWPAGAERAYREVVNKIFSDAEVVVTDELVGGLELRPSLDEIRARRRKYYPDET